MHYPSSLCWQPCCWRLCGTSWKSIQW